MSIFASILRMAYKLSGAKKAFALPEDALQKDVYKRQVVPDADDHVDVPAESGG